MQTCPTCGFSQNRDSAHFCGNCAAPLGAPTSVACPSCGMQNVPGARFCSGCGASLAALQTINCSSCGAANPTGVRFCSDCGAPLAGAPKALVSATGLLSPNTLLTSRYLVVKRLGTGGMGAVYQATDARIQGKLWAIKEMSDSSLPTAAERSKALADFRREAQLLATLDHANLPQVADFFEDAGKQYLVMDFIDGQTLEEIATSTPGFLPEATVLGWMEQVCDVLAYLHTCKPPIIFRDLKPSNIMLARDGKIKLIDFGIARLFKPGQSKDTAAFGTVGYAAPEQFGTGQTDARSDIYALGVTLHFLLTKYDPSLTPFSLPPARNINPQVSPLAEAVIIRATKSPVMERFQSAAEVRHAFLELAAQPVRPHFARATDSPLLTNHTENLPLLEASPPVLRFIRPQCMETQELHVFNRGGGMLRGRLSTRRPWISLDPVDLRSNNLTVCVRINTSFLPPVLSGQVDIAGEIEIRSNGGSALVRVTVAG